MAKRKEKKKVAKVSQKVKSEFFANLAAICKKYSVELSVGRGGVSFLNDEGYNDSSYAVDIGAITFGKVGKSYDDLPKDKWSHTMIVSHMTTINSLSIKKY